jgi:hypothetical protein
MTSQARSVCRRAKKTRSSYFPIQSLYHIIIVDVAFITLDVITSMTKCCYITSTGWIIVDVTYITVDVTLITKYCYITSTGWNYWRCLHGSLGFTNEKWKPACTRNCENGIKSLKRNYVFQNTTQTKGAVEAAYRRPFRYVQSSITGNQRHQVLYM